MTTRGDVVTVARNWRNVPYVHQGRTRHGVDCAGLPIVVARELELVAPDFDVNGYERSPDGKSLIAWCEQFMTRLPLESREPGHVLVIRWARMPQHMGILGDYKHGGLSIIHALGQSDGKGRVVEHRLDPDTLELAIALFAFPGVE